jgi:hypothetical protein
MRILNRSLLLFVVLAGMTAFAPRHGSAQSDQGRPNVFFDCEGRNCNSQYYRTEISWVNWVNDQAVSDVHVIMASLTTGAGGREYRLDFIGRNQQDEYLDQLVFQSLPTDTDREELDGLAHVLGLGLARFATVAGFRDIVSLEGPDPESSNPGRGRIVSQDEVDDPWNLWVFRLNGGGNVDGEETRKTERLNGSFNASRVTGTWKLNFNGYINYTRREIELTDSTFRDTRKDWGFNPLVVYSIADHWSVGFRGQLARMTLVNQRLRAELTPAVEFSVFPYEEATRRSLTAFYKIGPTYRDYFEETAFGQTAETRWEQSMEVEFSQRQTWGDAD